MNKEKLFLECRIFANYLVETEPSGQLLERYALANTILLDKHRGTANDNIVNFVHRHSWSLPFIDAISSLIDRDSILREKILIMVALLETTPDYVDFFIPKPSSKIFVVWNVCSAGILAATKVFVGIFIYQLAKRSK